MKETHSDRQANTEQTEVGTGIPALDHTELQVHVTAQRGEPDKHVSARGNGESQATKQLSAPGKAVLNAKRLS